MYVFGCHARRSSASSQHISASAKHPFFLIVAHMQMPLKHICGEHLNYIYFFSNPERCTTVQSPMQMRTRWTDDNNNTLHVVLIYLNNYGVNMRHKINRKNKKTQYAKSLEKAIDGAYMPTGLVFFHFFIFFLFFLQSSQYHFPRGFVSNPTHEK